MHEMNSISTNTGDCLQVLMRSFVSSDVVLHCRQVYARGDTTRSLMCFWIAE